MNRLMPHITTGAATVAVSAVFFILCAFSRPVVAGLSFPLDLERYTRVENGVRVTHLPAGVYEISETVFLPSNAILEGEGDGTVLRAAPGFRHARFITNRDFLKGNANIVLRSFRVEIHTPIAPEDPINDAPGLLRFENVEDLRFERLTMIIDSPFYGIDLSAHVRNAVVEGCAIVNRGSGGAIAVRNRQHPPEKATSNILIRGNRIGSFEEEPALTYGARAVKDEAISIFGWQGAVENIRVEKNTIRAYGASFGVAAYGIDTVGHRGRLRGVDIIGNDIEGSRHGAIGVKGGAQRAEVTDNSIRKTKGDGIFIHPGGEGMSAAKDVSVRRNRITDTGRHGVFADGLMVLVARNAITNCSGSGIYAAAGVRLSGNVITNARPGIIAEGHDDNNIRDNILRNAGQILFLRGAEPEIERRSIK